MEDPVDPGEASTGRRPSRIILGVLVALLLLGILISLALPTFVNYGDVGTTYQLRRGVEIARSWAAGHGRSYTGFDREQALTADTERTVAWGQPEQDGQHPFVQIRSARGDYLVLVAFNTRGDPYCVSDDLSRGTTTGSVDADSGADCVGGWSWTDWNLPPGPPPLSVSAFFQTRARGLVSTALSRHGWTTTDAPAWLYAIPGTSRTAPGMSKTVGVFQVQDGCASTCMVLVRLQPNGAIDTAFGTDGFQYLPVAQTWNVQPEGIVGTQVIFRAADVPASRCLVGVDVGPGRTQGVVSEYQCPAGDLIARIAPTDDGGFFATVVTDQVVTGQAREAYLTRWHL